MKRETVAAALLLILLAASILNISCLDRLIQNVEDEIDRAERSVLSEDFDAARKALRRAIQRWDGASSYTHIFIRHPEIDAVADAFHSLEGELKRENAEAAAAAFRQLRYHLDCVCEMEKIRLGSILSVISCR